MAVFASVAGCGVGGGDTTKQDGDQAGQDASVTIPAPGGEATEPGDDGFVASAGSSGGEAGAADRIEGVRFRIFDDYERLLIDFGREGGSAGVPRWSVESPAQGGYVRLDFPGLASTAITDEDFVGSVLDELYVVRDRGGGLFADVFAMHEFRYRVTELPGSGQLAVDFRGVREELDLPPTTGYKTVVLQPREAEEVDSPVSVQGYTRLFEGQVTISLLSREREVLSSKTVRANEWAAVWGLFEATLEFSDYEGLATLRVGSGSPRDGSFVGTETEVFLESSGPG
ncbi:Gmad2 immunoglobulin-like domain-containing protein [Rubrobacter tropicus]|uniref:Gmad2 immunoglobulin-like domain-containing protein n=1 Tax=Rubrobacter tropicus TaxID=2653851 RepID=UPI001A9E2534|nr:Gmad2 immunoglobulin-like domain-containing protein [Rubrobacter tropicus]